MSPSKVKSAVDSIAGNLVKQNGIFAKLVVTDADATQTVTFNDRMPVAIGVTKRSSYNAGTFYCRPSTGGSQTIGYSQSVDIQGISWGDHSVSWMSIADYSYLVFAI